MNSLLLQDKGCWENPFPASFFNYGIVKETKVSRTVSRVLSLDILVCISISENLTR